MKKINAFLIVLLLALTSLSACKKRKLTVTPPLTFDEYKLPVITNTGRNFFGFLSEGTPTWAEKKGIWDSPAKVKYIKANNEADFSFDGNSQYIDIHVKSALKVGETYKLMENPWLQSNSSAQIMIFTDLGIINGTPSSSMTSYLSDNTNLSTIKILYLDEARQIICGEFELKLKEYQGSKIISITKGRFDVNYRTY